MANWHYDDQGTPAGPVTEDDLRALVASGTVAASTRVWTNGMADWEAASTAAPFLFDAPEAMPEPSPEASFDTPFDAASEPSDAYVAPDPSDDPVRTYDPDALPEPSTPAAYDAPSAYAPPAASYDDGAPASDDGAGTYAPEPAGRPYDGDAAGSGAGADAYVPEPQAAAARGPMWHYERAGQPAGPVPESELERLAAAGTVAPTTRVWREGMSDWQSARMALPALFGAAVPARGGAAPAVGLGSAPAATGPYAEPNWLAFEGRIRRKTFGIRHLIMIGVSLVVFVPLYLVLGQENMMMMQGLSMLLNLVLLPTYAQRFRDVDKTGWLAVLSLVPCLNVLVFFYLLFVEGTPGPNAFGPDPKGRG